MEIIQDAAVARHKARRERFAISQIETVRGIKKTRARTMTPDAFFLRPRVTAIRFSKMAVWISTMPVEAFSFYEHDD